jgi:hypothetical protein
MKKFIVPLLLGVAFSSGAFAAPEILPSYFDFTNATQCKVKVQVLINHCQRGRSVFVDAGQSTQVPTASRNFSVKVCSTDKDGNELSGNDHCRICNITSPQWVLVHGVRKQGVGRLFCLSRRN